MKYTVMMQTINLTFASHYETSKERCYMYISKRVYICQPVVTYTRKQVGEAYLSEI